MLYFYIIPHTKALWPDKFRRGEAPPAAMGIHFSSGGAPLFRLLLVVGPVVAPAQPAVAQQPRPADEEGHGKDHGGQDIAFRAQGIAPHRGGHQRGQPSQGADEQEGEGLDVREPGEVAQQILGGAGDHEDQKEEEGPPGGGLEKAKAAGASLWGRRPPPAGCRTAAPGQRPPRSPAWRAARQATVPHRAPKAYPPAISRGSPGMMANSTWKNTIPPYSSSHRPGAGRSTGGRPPGRRPGEGWALPPASR